MTQMEIFEPEHSPEVETAIREAIHEERAEQEAFQRRMHDAFLIVRNAALVLDWNIGRILD